MFMNKYLIGILFCFVVMSCQTISVNQQSQILTETPVELGTIGLLNETVLIHNFESVAIPSFSKGLKLQVQPVTFSKQSFKAYQKANKMYQKGKLTFSDTLKVKPEYILIQFVNRVAITSQLNNSKNTGVRSYLETKQDAQMVTSISIAFSAEQLNMLKNATEVFLIQSSSKKFSLEIKSLDEKKQNLEFSDGVVFAYHTSSFCWKENDRHKLVIADLVADSEGCPPNTYRKSHKAIQKGNYFKL